MCKEELIAEVAAQAGITKRVAEDAVNAVVDTIIAAVSSGDKVQLNNFGTFELKHRNARIGRKPSTGEAVPIPARDIPWFTPGHAFKERV